MRYANTKFLIVTCYPLLHGQKRCCALEMPSLYLRSTLAFKPNRGTDLKRTYNGLITDLQRRYNGTASEAVGKLSQNLIEASIQFGRWFWNGFHVFPRFSSISNKENQPRIYAYCYAIETSVAYIRSLVLHITASLSLLQITTNHKRVSLSSQAKSRSITGNG